jgi:diguanylate cyclase (GGDEF)-like protein
LARFRRHFHPVSMLLLDVDNFKAINDRFGHDVGDQMIVHVAMLCDENRRESDIVARVGGEEFAILLPDTVLANSCLVGERLRQSISDRPLKTAGITVPVTVSIGIAEFEPAMTGVSDLMKLADRMLYRAKRAGRNRIASTLDKTQRPKLLRSPSISSGG